MVDETTVPPFDAGMTRRDAVQRVVALLGGLALVGGDRVYAFALDAAAIDQAMAQGVGAFTAADIALLDEIAETILPETSTPGAKAAKTGAFMALMVTDAYTDARPAGVPRRHAHARRRVPRGARQRLHAGDASPAPGAARGARPRAEDGHRGATSAFAHALSGGAAARRRARRTTSA